MNKFICWNCKSKSVNKGLYFIGSNKGKNFSKEDIFLCAKCEREFNRQTAEDMEWDYNNRMKNIGL